MLKILEMTLRKRPSCSITGILASDVMDEDKWSTLKEFADNSVVVEEVASMLNM
jgi:hypothetical protein